MAELQLHPAPRYALRDRPRRKGERITDYPSIAFQVPGPLEEEPIRSFNIRKWLDVALFVALLGVGYSIVTRDEDPDLGLFGSLLFNAGFTPFVLSTWALVTGASMFRRENAVKVLMSGIVFSTGYSLLSLHRKGTLTWDAVIDICGPALFEIGALFFISKMFFFGEDDERRIERLERELEQAKRSPGMGLALSYFYNFILPTASNMNRPGEQPTVVDIEISRGQFVPRALEHNLLLVFVPRMLDGTDIKAVIRSMQQNGEIVTGKPQDKKEAHRPLFVYLLSTEGQRCDGMFDVPTIISSIYERAKDQKEPPVDIRRELLDFQNNLVKLIASNPQTNAVVRVISVPNPQLDAQALRRLARAIQT